MKKPSYALCLSFLVAACGGPLKYQVPSSPRAPGADAKIVADVAKDQGQTHLELEITNLAPPGRISEKSSTYVAWYRKNSSATWSRVGGLKYDEGDREGKLSGSVPEIAFDLSVTAEENDNPASPSPDIVVAQRVEK
jgi:hypothetical protein